MAAESQEAAVRLVAFVTTLDVAVISGTGLLITSKAALQAAAGFLRFSLILSWASLVLCALTYYLQHWDLVSTWRMQVVEQMTGRDAAIQWAKQTRFQNFLDQFVAWALFFAPTLAALGWVAASACFGLALWHLL
jgi:Ni,Fe-hydrogenase I cytochrome b subunit